MQKIGKMIEEKRVCATTYHQNKWGEIEESKLKKHLQFIDSFQFMSQSLDRLSSNLPNDRFIYTDSESDGGKDGDLVLLKKKGVYPYDYMDSFQRFEERELPPIKEFYSVF